jgi:hypothetical protein
MQSKYIVKVGKLYADLQVPPGMPHPNGELQFRTESTQGASADTGYMGTGVIIIDGLEYPADIIRDKNLDGQVWQPNNPRKARKRHHRGRS